MSKKMEQAIKGRPKGTKSILRSLEEKEQIVLRCIKENIPYRTLGRELGIGDTTIRKWVQAYEKDGLKGLVSKTKIWSHIKAKLCSYLL